MADRFRVGQKVRVIWKESKRLGQVCTILASRIEARSITTGIEGLFYKVDFPPLNDDINFPVGYLEEDLEPVYDGDIASNWSESVWKPKEAKV